MLFVSYMCMVIGSKHTLLFFHYCLVNCDCACVKDVSYQVSSVIVVSFTATMLYVAIGSLNPVKIEAGRRGVEAALQRPVDARGFGVESGVAEQPIGDVETQKGAMNRAVMSWQWYIERHGSEPSYSIGIEGGVAGLNHEDTMTSFAFIVVYNGVRFGTAKTVTFELPEVVANLVRTGMELGHAVDTITGRANTKLDDGAVGWLSQGVITRMGFYASAVVLAFPAVRFPELYGSKEYLVNLRQESEESENQLNGEVDDHHVGAFGPDMRGL